MRPRDDRFALKFQIVKLNLQKSDNHMTCFFKDVVEVPKLELLESIGIKFESYHSQKVWRPEIFLMNICCGYLDIL